MTEKNFKGSGDATVNLSLKSLEASKYLLHNNKIGTQSIALVILKTVFTSASGIQVSSPDQQVRALCLAMGQMIMECTFNSISYTTQKFFFSRSYLSLWLISSYRDTPVYDAGLESHAVSIQVSTFGHRIIFKGLNLDGEDLL